MLCYVHHPHPPRAISALKPELPRDVLSRTPTDGHENKHVRGANLQRLSELTRSPPGDPGSYSAP